MKVIHHDFPEVIRTKKFRINIHNCNDTQNLERCIIQKHKMRFVGCSCTHQNHLRVSEEGNGPNTTASFFILDVTLQRLLRRELGLQHQSLRALFNLINFRINGHISMTFCSDSYKSFLFLPFPFNVTIIPTMCLTATLIPLDIRILNFRDTTDLR